MQRNRWETAIRCLEIAVHPNTTDEEIVAAVNGFRRTVESTPLRQLCREFAGGSATAPRAGDTERQDDLQSLRRQNLELHRRIAEIENDRAATLQRLRDAEQHFHHIGAELLAAQSRADAAEQRLDELSTYGDDQNSADHKDFDLQRAMVEARRDMAQPIHEPVRPFQNLLDAALRRPARAQRAPATPVSNHPWTA